MAVTETSERAGVSDRTRLILLSFLMLFVELALIRWLGEQVLYLSFFSNFVLLGSFLGIGIGFLRGSKVDLPKPGRLYAFLFVAIAVAWLVPQSALLGMALPVRFVAAIVLAFTPIFIANVVFAQRFKDTASSTAAFGANLLGAMVGGILEYGALVVGYRSLLLAAGAIYLLAYLTGRRHLLAAGSARAVGVVGS